MAKGAVAPALIIQTDTTTPPAEPNNENAQVPTPLPSSTGRTSESGYPLRVDSNGSLVNDNRTSLSSEVKPSRKQKSIEKRQKRWRWWEREHLPPPSSSSPFSDGILILFLIWRIFDHLLKMHITAANVWEFLPQPVDPHFDYFSISSSSETCNEWAREWAQAGKSVLFVSFFLTCCLCFAEPHNTGLGGSSVSVFGDAANNSCYYMDGSATSVPNIATFRGALQIEPNSEHIGAYSVAIPGEASNLWAIVELYSKLHRDESTMPLLAAISHIEEESSLYNMRLPISASLARTLEASNMDSQMVFRKKLARNVFGDQLEPLEEGSLFQPAAANILLVVSGLLKHGSSAKWDFDYNMLGSIFKGITSTVDSASFDGKGTGINYEALLTMLYKPSLNAYEPGVGEAMAPIEVGEGVSGCVSRTGGKGTFQPRTPIYMKSFKRPKKGKSVPHTENAEIYKAIFESMRALQNSTVNQPSDFYAQWVQGEKMADVFASHLNAIESQHVKRIKPHAPWTASMIAVVDHRRNQAFARTGTLGTGYGSLLQVPNEEVVLNNLMSQIGRYNSEVKGHQNDLQPMILFKNGKILTAYAGSGGYLTRSLDLARQFTSLIFSVFYDVSLAKALTTPLHFALPEKKQFISRGLPYSYANEIRKEHEGEHFADDESMIDMVAAVHNGRSVFFNGDDDVIEGQVMPNGF